MQSLVSKYEEGQCLPMVVSGSSDIKLLDVPELPTSSTARMRKTTASQGNLQACSRLEP